MSDRLASVQAFEVQVVQRASVTAEQIALAEERIGCELPAGLRRLYEERRAFYWSITDGEALGYEEDSEPIGGQLALVELTDLRVGEQGLVRFTNDGFGNGFCLDREHAKRGGAPIAFWDHDDEEATPTAKTFDAFFAWWAALGFAIDHQADGDLEPVVKFLKTGKLPRPKAKTPAVVTGRAAPLPRALRPLPAGDQVYSAVLDGDGHVLVGGARPVVRVVEIATARVAREIPSPDYVYGLAVTHDGRYVLYAGERGAQLLDAREGGDATPLASSVQMVATFADEDATAIVGGKDGVLTAYDVATRAEKWRASTHHAPLVSIAVAAGGVVVSHSFDPQLARVCVHDPHDGRELGRLEGAFLRPGSGVGLSVDGTHVLAPLGEGRVAQISLDDLRPASEVASTEGFPWYRVTALDERRVVAGRAHAFEVWSLQDGRVERTLEVEHGGVPSAILVPADRRRALLASYAGWVAEWKIDPAS